MTHEHQVTPIRTYILVWAALVILTFVTTAIAYIDLGPLNIVMAITIAVVKMTLVIWIFMGVRQNDSLTKLFVVAGFFWFAILIVFAGQDYFTRGWLPLGRMW